MAGLRSVTNKLVVAKKIIGNWGTPKEGQQPIPKRQLVLVTDDGAETVNCTEEVLNKVEVYKEYRFVVDNNCSEKKTKLVDVLFEEKEDKLPFNKK